MEQPGHTYSFRTLIATYVSLMILAALMVGISRIDMVSWSSCQDVSGDFLCALAHLFDMQSVKTSLVLGIALLMGTLTALILMGLAYEKKLINAIVFLSNFPFLAIFIVFTWADYNFRTVTDPSFHEQINWESPVLKANEKKAAGDSASVKPAHAP